MQNQMEFRAIWFQTAKGRVVSKESTLHEIRIHLFLLICNLPFHQKEVVPKAVNAIRSKSI